MVRPVHIPNAGAIAQYLIGQKGRLPEFRIGVLQFRGSMRALRMFFRKVTR